MKCPNTTQMLKKAECKYELVTVVSKRAKQIIDGAQPLVDCEGKEVKPVIVAINELADDKYTFHHVQETGQA